MADNPDYCQYSGIKQFFGGLNYAEMKFKFYTHHFGGTMDKTLIRYL